MAEFNINGLDKFAEYFQDFTDNYIIVGGTACSLVLNDAGIPFRATKDIDMIITVEELSHGFGERLWDFINAGQYSVYKTKEGVQQYFRFKEPRVEGYQFMIELFSRKQDIFLGERTSTLIPLSIDEEISSLSAILLNDEYYAFLKSGRQIIKGISVLAPTHLIAFKARAYLDLFQRKKDGHHVNAGDIKKHRNDIFRLSQLLTGQEKIACNEQVKNDIYAFFALMQNIDIDLKVFGISATQDEIVELVTGIYI